MQVNKIQFVWLDIESCRVFWFFFYWDSLHARLNSHYQAWSYKKKKHKKIKATGNLFRKNLQLKDVCNSRLKATKMIGQRKAFYRQRIPESTCARKETVVIDILVTSRNGDRKIMQSFRTTSRKREVEPVEPVL